MRRDISFKTEDGVVLRGWLYLPDRAAGQVPTIVMAHGFSAGKEMYLGHYAEAVTGGGGGGRGALSCPDRAAGQVPTIVMAHGFSAVKEMYLDHYAESFTAGGLGALV